MRGPRLASSNLFQLLGLVNGVTEDKDIPEELLKQKEQKQERGRGGWDYEDVNTDQESVDKEGDEKKAQTHPLLKRPPRHYLRSLKQLSSLHHLCLG